MLGPLRSFIHLYRGCNWPNKSIGWCGQSIPWPRDQPWRDWSHSNNVRGWRNSMVHPDLIWTGPNTLYLQPCVLKMQCTSPYVCTGPHLCEYVSRVLGDFNVQIIQTLKCTNPYLQWKVVRMSERRATKVIPKWKQEHGPSLYYACRIMISRIQTMHCTNVSGCSINMISSCCWCTCSLHSLNV